MGHANAARAALDIALLDWLSKFYHLPCHRFLGVDPHSVPATSYSIGIDSPEMIRQKIMDAADFKYLKVKLGGDNDQEIVDTIRCLTRKPIRVDANEGWTTPQLALQKIEWLASERVEFVEQPMPAGMLDEMAWVRERSPLPVIADESAIGLADIPKLVGAFDGINIKLMKAGGLQPALDMIAVARAHNLKVMLGCMIESSVAISAAACIAPLADYVDLDANLLVRNDPFTGVESKKGIQTLLDIPGIGAVPRRNQN